MIQSPATNLSDGNSARESQLCGTTKRNDTNNTKKGVHGTDARAPAYEPMVREAPECRRYIDLERFARIQNRR